MYFVLESNREKGKYDYNLCLTNKFRNVTIVQIRELLIFFENTAKLNNEYVFILKEIICSVISRRECDCWAYNVVYCLLVCRTAQISEEVRSINGTFYLSLCKILKLDFSP